MNTLNKGQLFIVSTPIGNLRDITVRALKVLEEVDFILAEDTRQTIKLLDQYQIKKELVSYRDQNHTRIIDQIVKHLSEGKNIALVSDAGTPLISDPGYKLVRDLKDKGFSIVSIPGPSAVISALTISGLPTDKFIFLGFLPKSDTKRRNIISEYAKLDATLIIYESPFRVHKLLEEITEILSDRDVSLVKDITKLYEKDYFGKAIDILKKIPDRTKMKGEYVVLIGKEDK